MASIIDIAGLTKRYASGFEALKGVDLSIEEGEIFALLGPNGAGKTTMISIVCGIARPTSGTVRVAGHDILRDYRGARSAIGLVPQELSTDQFERVIDTVTFSRGLFGKPRNDAYVEKILRDLSLWDKRHNKILELSGGMKRRVMIAKALSHEPRVLFLDEPTAGVDVELRRDMWKLIGELRQTGVTIILTTHYIEEAEEMADRIGIIHQGKFVAVGTSEELRKQSGSDGVLEHSFLALTRQEAIRMYTIENARVLLMEREVGSLEPGKRADFVVLDRDPLSCPLDDLPDYVPNHESPQTHPQLAARFPLNIVSPKSHAFLNSCYANMTNKQRAQGEQFVLINAADAAPRGILPDSRVRIWNDRGAFEAVARVTDDVNVGVVVSTLGYWRQPNHGTVNAVSSAAFADMGHAPSFSDNLVEVAPA